MLMDLTSPSKHTIWQTGLKRKMQQSVAYRRPTKLWVKGRKNIYQDNGSWKQSGAATFISDKEDFKLTLIK
jgi:hypothetical protein